MTQTVRLHVLKGAQQGQVFRFVPSATPTIIGKRETAHVNLLDAWVSGEHARLTYDGQIYWLEDADSSNGTFVNKKRIRKVALRDQDTIWFGRTKTRFVVDVAGDASGAIATPVVCTPAMSTDPTALAQAVSAATEPLVSRIASLQADVVRLESELKQRDARIRELETAAASPSGGGGSAELEYAREQIAELESELQTLLGEAVAGGRIGDPADKARIAELEQENAELRDTVEQVQKELCAEIQELEQRLAAAELSTPEPGSPKPSFADVDPGPPPEIVPLDSDMPPGWE